MTADRLLKDEELIKYFPKIVAVDAVTFAVQLANMATLIREAQDAKTIKWVASKEDDIANLVFDSKFRAGFKASSKEVADAIISLLVGEAKS